MQYEYVSVVTCFRGAVLENYFCVGKNPAVRSSLLSAGRQKACAAPCLFHYTRTTPRDGSVPHADLAAAHAQLFCDIWEGVVGCAP